jgi:hypothetical protein
VTHAVGCTVVTQTQKSSKFYLSIRISVADWL